MTGYLSISQTAERLGLAVDTVRQLERRGELEAVRTAGGHRRFHPDDVEAYRRKRKASGRRTYRSPAHSAKPGRSPAPPRRRRPTPTPPPLAPAPDAWDDEPHEFWDEPEEEVAEVAAPTPRRAEPVIWAANPPPVHVPPVPPAATHDDTRRLDDLKQQAVASIPYDVPGSWRMKVVEDLERYVTAERFKPWIPDWQAQRMVRERVEHVLRPYREQLAAAAARKQAENDARARVRSLIEHGQNYAWRETIPGWDFSAALEARRAVEEELDAKVQADWTRYRVEKLVDDILADWEVEDDEEAHDEGEDGWEDEYDED